MGKAALILVFAGGIIVAYGALSTQETSHHTARSQANYEETILAREIARTGFNAAMSVLRQHGDDLQAGVNAIMGTEEYFEGESQGGIYRATARFISGHTVEVASVGYFGGAFSEQGEYVGGATYVIDDNFTHHLPRTPLHAAQCSRLKVDYLNAQSSTCSAVYLVRQVPGASQPGPPELLFASASSRGINAQLPMQKAVLPGTRMNFFIAVDQNCSQAPPNWQTYDYGNHTFHAGNYSHVHYALEQSSTALTGVREGLWALVEQHPMDNQRWRIAWEDQNLWGITNPNHGHFHNPERSMLGLKMYGYDGQGWPVTDANGYRQLRSYSGRPDLNDQVIQVSLEPVQDCSELIAGDPSEWEDPDIIGGYSPPGGPSELIGLDENGFCPCPGIGPKNHKILIRHLPPGNTDNAQDICIAKSAWEHHQRHGDTQYCVGDDSLDLG